MKKILLILFILPIFAKGQTFPDSTRQTGGTNFTPQFNYKGTPASTGTTQFYNPVTGKYFGLYSAFQSDQRYAQIAGASAVVDGITQLVNYSGTATVVTVKDKLRGGQFAKRTGLTVDSGLVFPANTGQWVRLGYNGTANSDWYGVSPDSTQNGARIMNWVNSPYAKTLNIIGNIPMERDIYINGKTGLTINVLGTLTRTAETTYTLTADLLVGGNRIYIANANKYFKVGDVISTIDNNAPQGGGSTTSATWKIGNAGRTTAVTSTYMDIDTPARYNATVAANGMVFKKHNIFVVLNSTNIKIIGGTLDGNKANAYYNYPQTTQTECFICATGISVLASTDVSIKDVKIKNFGLHGIKTAKYTNRLNVENVIIDGVDSKGIIAHFGGKNLYFNNIRIINTLYEDAFNINGSLGDPIDSVFATNIFTANNGRYGIRSRGNVKGFVLNGFSSVNDGIGVSVGGYSMVSNGYIRAPRDIRGLPGVDLSYSSLNADSAGSKFNNIVLDSVGNLKQFVYVGAANNTFSNLTYRNMPVALSATKQVATGPSAANNTTFFNSTYDNIDEARIYKWTNGSTMFGTLPTGTTFVFQDIVSFSGQNVNGRRAYTGVYRATGDITLTGTNLNDFGFSATPAGSYTWSGAQIFGSTSSSQFTGSTFPVQVWNPTGNTAIRFGRTATTGQFDWLMNSTNDLVYRSYLPTATAYMTIPAGTTNIQLTALTASRPLQLDASKNIISSPINLASANNVTGALPNANLANSSIGFATPGTTGTAPNWTTSPVSLGGTATLNIPNAATTSVTGGLVSKTQYDDFAKRTGGNNLDGVQTVTGDSQSADGMGIVSVTRSSAGGNKAYIGMTRRLAIAWAEGISSNNEWIWGTGPLRNSAATIDTIKAKLSSSGDLTLNGWIKSQHPAGTAGTDSVAVILSDGRIGRVAASAFGYTAGINAFTNRNSFTTNDASNPTITAINNAVNGVALNIPTGLASFNQTQNSGYAGFGSNTGINSGIDAFEFKNITANRATLQFLETGNPTPFNVGWNPTTHRMGKFAAGTTGFDAFALSSEVPTLLRLTGSGTGASTTISIAHGLTGVTSASIALVQPINIASAGVSYVTTDATNINIIYTVAPPSGTNNLSYNVSIKP